MLPDERLQLGQRPGVPAQRQLPVEAQLERREPQLLEPGDRRLRERLVREVGNRRPAPQRERSLDELDCRLRVGAAERLRRLGRPPLEADEVQALGLDVQDVAGRAGLDLLRTEQLAELRNLPLNLRHRRHRWLPRVQVVGEPLDRDDPVGGQEQDPECGALLRPGKRDRPVVVHDLERSEDPKLKQPR